MKKIKLFNSDQLLHQRMVQELILKFCTDLLSESIIHDESKWSDHEYEQFIDSRESLRGSKDGKDEEYQKNLKSEAIQHHITQNEHHPEYWTSRNEEMPLDQAIIMFFDWYSRCLQKHGNIDDFWDYNMKKLEKQPRAKAVVELLKQTIENPE